MRPYLFEVCLLHIENEARIGEVVELGALRGEIGDQLPIVGFEAVFAHVELEPVAVEQTTALVMPPDSSLLAQWKEGSRTISSSGSHCDL